MNQAEYDAMTSRVFARIDLDERRIIRKKWNDEGAKEDWHPYLEREAQKVFVEKMEAEGWVCTDPDQNQYRKNVSEDVFIFREERIINPETGKIKVFEEEIDITEYKYNDIDSDVSTYGYVLLDNYLLDGYDLQTSKELIAECIFELSE